MSGGRRRLARGGLAALALALGLAVALGAGAGAGTPAGVEAVRAAFAGPVAAGETRALFIGNSFTREHDLPAQVAAIAARQGVVLRAGMIVRDGAWLEHHLAAPGVAGVVRDLAWDVLVLQDHSVVALTPAGAAASRAAVAGFAALRAEGTGHAAPGAGSAAPGKGAAGQAAPRPTRLVLFATWARAPGHPLYAAEGMPATPAHMTARVSAHYAGMAEAIGARVAGVGDAFLSVAARPGAAALHAGDGYHASAEGARLAASILAAAILGRPVAPLPERAWRDPGAPPAVQPVRSIVAR